MSVQLDLERETVCSINETSGHPVIETAQTAILAGGAAFAMTHEAFPLVCISGKFLYDGYQDLKKKKFAKGALELALGVGGIVAAGYYLCSTLFPQTTRESSPVQSPEYCLFTSYTTDRPERLEMSKIVAENQRNYTRVHGYSYAAHEENLAPDSLPYWSKIAGIRNYLAGNDPLCPNPKWVVWLDDDAIVTNPGIKMDEFIQGHMQSPGLFSRWTLQSPNIIVTQDVKEGSINTGVLIVRNCEASRKFFDDLWEMRNTPSSSAPDYSYGTCPNQICLHEQEAMQDLLRKKGYFDESGVKVIGQHDPQNIEKAGLNTFKRYNHYDADRGMFLNYDFWDRPKNRYHRGDFVAQCTGLATRGYFSKPENGVRNLRLDCIEELAEDSLSAID